MKKVLLGIISLLVIMSYDVSAEEVYYRNNNGLPFTKYQYDVTVDRLDEEKVASMSYKTYNLMGIADITESNYYYEKKDLVEKNNAKGTYYETTCKRIVISKNCSGDQCTVVFTNNWKCYPAVKSYDISGIRLSSTNFALNNYSAVYESDGKAKNPEGSRGASNGVGYAFKVPSSGDIGFSAVSATIKKTGTVYGSYQHGVKNMSLSRALDFTFNPAGLGGVFDWGNYDNYFDQMGGIYIPMTA